MSCALSCPCCHDHTLNSDSMWSPSPITMAMLGSLPVTCVICCREVQQLTRHLDTKCSTLFRHDSPSKTTIKEILSKPGTSTPSPAERRVAGTLIKRMMMDGNSGVVQVPTGSHGQVCRKYTHFHIAHYNNYKQPLTLMQVPSCRVPTSEASPITIRRRSHQLAKVRDTISGGASLERDSLFEQGGEAGDLKGRQSSNQHSSRPCPCNEGRSRSTLGKIESYCSVMRISTVNSF